MEPKVLSCGVLILNASHQILLCHSTGNSWWDIPKGHCDEGETPLQAALREVQEETSLVLHGPALMDLGVQQYLKSKDLHLFATRLTTALDPKTCVCTSYFPHYKTGKPTPEADDFAWVDFAEVSLRCAKNMTRVLTQTLSLESIMQQLTKP